MTAGEFFKGMLYSQYIASIPKPTQDFSGKVIIVTGANTGLGLEACRWFVTLGARRVILACRSEERGEQAKNDIISSQPNAQTLIEVWPLDLGSYDSVEAFARKAQSLDRLDVLVENAGIAAEDFKLIEENEAGVTINVVSTYLLALLMLPKLRETATSYQTQPHLSIVASDMHYMVDLSERKQPRIFEALSDPKTADMKNRYPNTKLLQVMVARELVRLYLPAGSPIVLNLVNPALCRTDLNREGNVAWNVFKVLFMARSSECGSRTLVHAASAGEESHGQFLSECAVRAPSSFVLSEEGVETQKRVWEELSQKLEKISPGILQNL